SEGRPVVQYRQQIMPLVDLGAALGGGSGVFDDATHVSVIVCSRDGQTIGVAVRRILDVVAHADGLETIVDGTERVVVNGLITDVVDLAAAISSVRPSIHGGADDQGLADHGQPGGTRTDLSAQSRPVGV
ncbi:MAG: chemotaxis protein CheW, partial [Actinomycetota bacterium]